MTLVLVENFSARLETSLVELLSTIPSDRSLTVRVDDCRLMRVLVLYDDEQVWYHFERGWRKTER